VSRYHELAAKVDAFFARAQARHGNDMQCGTGCSDCCHVRLSVTGVEAAAIRAELAAWPIERRAALAANIAGAAPDRCAALDAGGRCLIYAARPYVCRSHGAPIRLQRGSLPVLASRDLFPASSTAEGRCGSIQSCFRNFTRTEPDSDCVLDQTTLSALVLAVDRDAGGDGGRIDLAELLRSC
jgi:Fe-S-cluster containining protein